MPSFIESEIESLVATFVADLTSLLHASALDVVQEALGVGRVRAPRQARGAKSRAPTTGGKRLKGAKRDPKDIEALTEKLASFVKKTPGQRIEQIGKALSTSTKDLALPVKKLVAAKRLSTKGQKRATTYFPR
jgi:hypothetical protein